MPSFFPGPVSIPSALGWLFSLALYGNSRYIAMRSRAFIHDRMPLILPEQYVGEWIKPETRPEELVKEAQTEMYFEKE